VERLVVLGVPVDTIRERFVFAAPLAAANDDELAALVERHLAADDVQVLPAIGELTDSTAARKGARCGRPLWRIDSRQVTSGAVPR
jgi:hypothetical protein